MTEKERFHLMHITLERRRARREEEEREYIRTHPVLCNCVECGTPLRGRDLCCPDASPNGVICLDCFCKRIKPVKEVTA